MNDGCAILKQTLIKEKTNTIHDDKDLEKRRIEYG